MEVILPISIAILDQAIKGALCKFSSSLPVDVIKGVLSITVVRNTGAAFGILKGQKFFFIGVSLTAIIAIVAVFAANRFFSKKNFLNNKIKIGLSLILGGAIGNMIDRINFGYVIDYIDFKIWPVFNFADTCICIGIFMILLDVLVSRKSAK